jgi:HK97 family phage portal protein
MKLSKLLPARVKSWLGMEGANRGMPWAWGEFGGGPFSFLAEQGFQRNLDLPSGGARNVSAVYACAMLSARAISQCKPMHLVRQADGSYEQSTTSPASRILRIPNDYETWTQLIFNTCASMLFEGEALWLAVRDDRYAIVAVHRVPRGAWSIHVDPDTRQIFYSITASDVSPQPDYLVPARDVCHFRQHTPRHPLIGESPIKAAAMAIGISVALNSSQLAFFNAMNRPSGVLTTDATLTADQMKQLRLTFNEQSKLWAQGGMPILSSGLKFQPMGVAQSDSQLIEQQKMSTADIARVFGVPVALISDTSGPQGGTEAMISHWLSIGLGSLIESIERSLDRLFNFGPGEGIELDPAPLLRVDFSGRIDGLVKAVQGGLLTPDEARSKEGYGKIDGGDQAYLQRQMTPMSQLLELNAADLKAKLEPPAPAPAPEPAAEPEPEPEKQADPEVAKALVAQIIKKAKAHA